MQKISYALMNPDDGLFLRVYSTEHEEDCITPYREFTLEQDDPIYETNEAAALLDILVGRQNGRYLSGEARSEWIPRMGKSLIRRNVQIGDYVPVAFVRELQPVVQGGDFLVTSMSVQVVRFDNTADPETIRLVDLENRHCEANTTSSP